MRTCSLNHDELATRYCGQCGAKIAQPLEDLRAHCLSQSIQDGKSPAAQNKWKSWLKALDEKLLPSTTFTTP